MMDLMFQNDLLTSYIERQTFHLDWCNQVWYAIYRWEKPKRRLYSNYRIKVGFHTKKGDGRMTRREWRGREGKEKEKERKV